MGNGPYILVDAFAPPFPIVPPVPMAPIPLVFLLLFVELMPGVVVAPLGGHNPPSDRKIIGRPI